MSDHLFISYSSVDGETFALRLADELAAGPPEKSIWMDKRKLRPGEDWDEQIVEAIRTCKAIIFVMTQDSVQPMSVCKNEWVRALKYKKPVIPLLVNPDAELPFRLGSRQHIDFTEAFDGALAKLRRHLEWLDSQDGQLQALKYRLEDARRELPRTKPEKQARIRADITDLERQIAQQQTVIADPEAAKQRVQESIERGLEREREPAEPIRKITHGKFINPPPTVAPTWFQDRHVETRLIGDFLKDDALRLMTVVGRAGIGKTAMVCRLLRSIESGQLPDDGGPWVVDGIVYLSNAREFHRVNVPELYASLTKLLPEQTAARLDSVYKNPGVGTRETMQALLEGFPSGRTLALLDNFEDIVDVETGHITDPELNDALHALLELPPHGIKVIITTRVAPRDLALVEPGRQRRLELDEGLDHPFAENVLRAMDADGTVGLRDAPDALLAEARKRTRGYPRALEALFGILSADRNTSLPEILEDTRQLLPENVVKALVGEAFSRLDLMAQRVMQALAVYRYPVAPAAVDYLLQPFVSGIDSAPTLSRLVNMQFVRREAGRYYLHQVDRDYALNRIPEGKPEDRQAEIAPFTRFGLQHRAAEWFRRSRKPKEACKSLEDLSPQLAEFELRREGKDYDAAAAVLLEIDFAYLMLWGHFRLTTELHEGLQGKIGDLALKQISIGNLGSAYFRIGQYQRVIGYFEEALAIARKRKDRKGEGDWLGGLGSCYAALGQTTRAMELYREALAIRGDAVEDRIGVARDMGNLGNRFAELGEDARAIECYTQAIVIYRDSHDQLNEALNLSNLGDSYATLGQTDEAMEALNQALTIARQEGSKLIEAASLSCMGYAYLSLANYSEAAKQFKLAINISDATENLQYQSDARLGYALANLYQGQLAVAREFVEAARQYNVPLNNPAVMAVLGVIALRQGHRSAAHNAFVSAVNLANDLLQTSPRFYGALDAKAVALCGLAITEGAKHEPAAVEAYRAARAITRGKGVVARVLRLIDALSQADTTRHPCGSQIRGRRRGLFRIN